MFSSGVYEILNTVTGKRYIGSAVRFNPRWNGHRVHLKRGSHHSRGLQSAWLKYGPSAFIFRPIIICEKQMVLFYEQIALDALQPEYNSLKIAGSCIGREVTAETRAKISRQNAGRKRSPEFVERLRQTMTGSHLSPERAAKLIGNKHALGHKHSDEWKRQNSIRNTGVKRPKSPEHRAKIAASLRGRKATPEHRANQAAAQRGTKRRPYRLRSAPPNPKQGSLF